MVRLLTHVDEVFANAEPSEPFEWFRSFGDPAELERGNDRCLLLLAFDADRKENTVRQMLHWFEDFQKKLDEVDTKRFATTVFVLDWPHTPENDSIASTLTSKSIDDLMAAGICYRPKDKRFYGERSAELAKALHRDLSEKGLIPKERAHLLGEAVQAKPTPDDKNPEIRAVKEFLGTMHFVWPPEAVRELFRR